MTVLADVAPAVLSCPAGRRGKGRHRRRAWTPPWTGQGATSSRQAIAARAVDAHPKAAAGRLADLLLTVAAVLGLVILGITVTAHVTGLRPLVVKSGSMEPTIPTGGMVLVRTIPAAQIEVGDVVAVERPDRTRVTHRVTGVVHEGATASLTLQGDANEDPDPLPVTVDSAGRLVLSVPSIGRVSAFLASAKGGFLLGCLFTAAALPVLRRREHRS
ncbi:MAG: signal peptidase I [Actinobacteria bacterium]|nr:signal peptidase I [Actinomycetota bacterium]MBW3648371.1 signal peptidase I [Actinomycetota bacterium]